MIRTNNVVPLGKVGSVDLITVAGMPGAEGGEGAIPTDRTEGEAAGGGVAAGKTGAAGGPETGLPSIAIRRHCGSGPALATAISSLAPG
jgi:hypothetical protein